MINKRLLKCLKRIKAGKSLPDFDAVLMLVDRKLINMYGNSSDDVGMEITEKGEAALKDATPQRKDVETE